MSETIIIEYPQPASDSVVWWDLASAQRQHGAMPASADDVIILLSADVVSCYQTSIPSTQMKQLRAAVPFALEDQLASSLEDNHFTVRPINDQRQSVYVINKQRMRECMDFCLAQGIHATRCVPLIACIDTDTWLMGDDGLYGVDTHGRGFFLAAATLQQQSVQPLLRQQTATQKTLCAVDAPWDDDWNISEHDVAAHAVTFLRQHPVKINCLHGDFTPQRRTQANQQILKYLTVALGIFLGLSALKPIVAWWHYRKILTTSDQTISRIYREYFPKATDIVAPKFRLQQLLRERADAAAQEPLLQLIARVGAIKAQHRQIALQQMRYSTNTLTLTLSAPSFAVLQSWETDLRGQGVRLRQVSATTSKTQINAVVECRL